MSWIDEGLNRKKTADARRDKISANAQNLYETLWKEIVYGWLFRGLFHNVTNSFGDRGLEHHTLGLQASKVHTHELARLEHHSV